MFYGYGILNNHVPTLKATAMRVGAAISSLLTGLYAVYKAESNANDSLGAYNGTAVGGLTYTTGKSGNAFTFNGTSAYVELPNNMFNSFTGDFSISLWFYSPSFSGFKTLIATDFFNGATSFGWNLYLNGSTLVFDIYNGGDVILNSSGSIPINTWTNVVVTRKATTSTKIYVNGTLNASNTSIINPAYNTTQYCTIGNIKYSASGLTYYYNGSIDEANIWAKELTATDVTALYNSGAGKFYPTF